MEEPGEQCSVVFALIVTEPAGRGCVAAPPLPLAGFETIKQRRQFIVLPVPPWNTYNITLLAYNSEIK
jgi:hypothetical protein